MDVTEYAAIAEKTSATPNRRLRVRFPIRARTNAHAPTASRIENVVLPKKYPKRSSMNAIGEFGCRNQNATVASRATRFASQAYVHGRNSTRRTDRVSARKKAAIISAETICAPVLQR